MPRPIAGTRHQRDVGRRKHHHPHTAQSRTERDRRTPACHSRLHSSRRRLDRTLCRHHRRRYRRLHRRNEATGRPLRSHHGTARGRPARRSRSRMASPTDSYRDLGILHRHLGHRHTPRRRLPLAPRPKHHTSARPADTLRRDRRHSHRKRSNVTLGHRQRTDHCGTRRKILHHRTSHRRSARRLRTASRTDAPRPRPLPPPLTTPLTHPLSLSSPRILSPLLVFSLLSSHFLSSKGGEDLCGK